MLCGFLLVLSGSFTKIRVDAPALFPGFHPGLLLADPYRGRTIVRQALEGRTYNSPG